MSIHPGRDAGYSAPPAEAHGLLAPVYASFGEGFELPDLAEARELLDGLGPPPVHGSGRVPGQARASDRPDGSTGPIPSR